MRYQIFQEGLTDRAGHKAPDELAMMGVIRGKDRADFWRDYLADRYPNRKFYIKEASAPEDASVHAFQPAGPAVKPVAGRFA